LLRLIAVACALALPAGAFAQDEHHAPAGEAHGAAPAGEAHGDAHGEGAGEHGGGAHAAPSFDVKRFGFQVLNFAVLLFLLVKFGGPAVKKALEARSQQIKSDLASAAEARAAAQARFEKQEQRLAALESEIEAIRAGIKQEAEAEKVRLIAMAEDRARRIREESEFIIEQQVKQAEEDLRREVAAQAVALAEQIVRSQLGPADQQRLVDTFVGDIAHNGKPATSPPAPPAGGAAGAAAPRSQI
jgi:F-type H+-transporting ATPase subunit b